MNKLILIGFMFLIVMFSGCIRQLNKTPTTPSVEPIIGKWYAPPPDDLTFEFRPGGTFIETSPRFNRYEGTWKRVGDNLYDATVLDGWGVPKLKNFLYQENTLMTGGITILQRVR